MENPYQPPASAVAAYAPPLSSDEAVRKQYLNHEASVQSVGTLYLIGGVLIFFSAAGSVMMALMSGRGSGMALPGIAEIGIILALFAFAVLQLWIAFGLRKLKRSVRIPAIILSIIGLLGFPIGTLISGWVLYMLASKKGSLVFSDEYRRVIAATPHIKYRTSRIVWVGLILILAFILFGTISVYLKGR